MIEAFIIKHIMVIIFVSVVVAHWGEPHGW